MTGSEAPRGSHSYPSPLAFPIVELEGGVKVVRAAMLEAALPGLTAVFSTRLGGVSSPPWNSLNLGYHVGDSPADVTQNRLRFFRALGLDPDSLVTAAQVHSPTVAVVTEPGRHEATDGLVTISRGLTLAVFCADCVPVWLVDPRVPAAGAVHAGWKGTLAGIAGRAVEIMARRFRSRPRDILAAVGPSIGPCCYEVGPEVAGPASERFGPAVISGTGPAGRPLLDLWEANRLALILAGVDPSRVFVSGLCTFCRADLFHSHRREVARLAAAAATTPPNTPASATSANPPAGSSPPPSTTLPRAGRMAAVIRLPVA